MRLLTALGLCQKETFVVKRVQCQGGNRGKEQLQQWGAVINQIMINFLNLLANKKTLCVSYTSKLGHVTTMLKMQSA